MILRKKIETIFTNRITDDYPAQSVMKGHDTTDRDDQPGVTVMCHQNTENQDFQSRSGVYQCGLMLIVESNVQDADNTQSSIETLAGNLAASIEDLSAVRTLCTASYPEIYIHDILPSDDLPDMDGYNLNNTFNYLLVYEYLNV